jgi:hypothetical protein
MKFRLGAALLLPALASTLVACGPGNADTADTASAANGMQAYTDCLRKQGITLPSSFGTRASGRPTAFPSDRPTDRPTAFPSGGTDNRGGFGGFGQNPPSGVDAEKWQAAQKACESVRPSSGPGNGGQRPGGGGLNAAYRNCLTEHGVTLQQGQQLNTADAKVTEAMKACAPLRPSSTPSN